MENNEEAMIELQTKLSFQEDLLESLNQVIVDQQSQITKLERMMEAMLGQLDTMQAAMQQGNGQQHEIPPHY